MSNYTYWAEDDTEAIEHYGTLGQKWGRRRYQYEDGSLTPEGRKRYRDGIKSTSSGSSYDHSKFADGSRVYRELWTTTGDAKGNPLHNYAQPVSRPTDPGLTETWMKYMERAASDESYLGNLENTNATNARRAMTEAERNELMNEKAFNTTQNMARRNVEKGIEEWQKQQQYNRELAKTARQDAKLEARNQQEYDKKQRDTNSKYETDLRSKVATLKEKQMANVNATYNSGDTRNIIQKAADTYVSGWNTIKDTYVSGLKTIAGWFK